jgi:hypothetical protein
MLLPRQIERLHNLMGRQAAIAYRELLLAHEGVKEIRFCHYQAAPFLQQRIELNSFEQEIVATALVIRSNTKIPFWEAIFAACLKAGKSTNALLDAVLLHQGQGKVTGMSVDELRQGALEEVSARTGGNIGLSSEILFEDGDVRHLALLDLHCEISPANTDIVSEVCRRVMPGGFLLLDSGDSYHACGVNLMTNSERIECLAKSTLFAPIVDTVYVAHQLLQPASSIRISAGGKRNKHPTVVAVHLATHRLIASSSIGAVTRQEGG